MNVRADISYPFRPFFRPGTSSCVCVETPLSYTGAHLRSAPDDRRMEVPAAFLRPITGGEASQRAGGRSPAKVSCRLQGRVQNLLRRIPRQPEASPCRPKQTRRRDRACPSYVALNFRPPTRQRASLTLLEFASGRRPQCRLRESRLKEAHSHGTGNAFGFLRAREPMNALLRNPYTESWLTIGAGIPRPTCRLTTSRRSAWNSNAGDRKLS
jgi:hypothetical protein